MATELVILTSLSRFLLLLIMLVAVVKIVLMSKDSLVCYYQTRDDGTVKWDRRMKPCRAEISVEKGYCSTVGKNTCYVLIEAYDGNGNGFGSDSAYYSIK